MKTSNNHLKLLWLLFLSSNRLSDAAIHFSATARYLRRSPTSAGFLKDPRRNLGICWRQWVKTVNVIWAEVILTEQQHTEWQMGMSSRPITYGGTTLRQCRLCIFEEDLKFLCKTPFRFHSTVEWPIDIAVSGCQRYGREGHASSRTEPATGDISKQFFWPWLNAIELLLRCRLPVSKAHEQTSHSGSLRTDFHWVSSMPKLYVEEAGNYKCSCPCFRTC